MDPSSIRQRIHDFVLTTLLEGEDAVNLTDSTPLVSGGVIDSLSSLKLGLFLDKAFSVRIAPEELSNPENLETIPAIVALVTAKLASAGQ